MKTYDISHLDEVAFELRNNKSVITKTDTVYGILSLKEDNIYTIKKRSRSKKIVKFINDVSEIKDLSPKVEKLLMKYWPGQLTIVFNGISYRIPDVKFITDLISIVGPVYSSSANISHYQPITSLARAKKVFEKHSHDIILVNNKDTKLSSISSTIIDITNNLIIREGSVDGAKVLRELATIKNKETS